MLGLVLLRILAGKTNGLEKRVRDEREHASVSVIHEGETRSALVRALARLDRLASERRVQANTAVLNNKDDLQEHKPDDGILRPWHANVVEMAKTPVVLFANDRTLLNFFVDVTDDGPMVSFRQTFSVMLSCVLSDLGVEPHIRDRLLDEYATIHFAPTNNRRVIGSMNGMPMSMLTEISPDRSLFKLVEVL